jgi:AmpD protein
VLIDIETGLIEGARQVASPNCDDRPQGVGPELLVIHGISLPPGEFGGPWIDRLFTNSLPKDVHPYFIEVADLKVSSHLLIRRQGELVQYVPLNKRAWHAGQSCFQGRECCNDFSIGIELEGSDELAYTEIQYAKLNQLVAVLLSTYPSLSADRIVGHSDIAPGRKTDPGEAFDWQRLRRSYLAGL